MNAKPSWLDPIAAKPPKPDYGATGRYWLLLLLILIGVVTLSPRSHLRVGFWGVWLSAIAWMVIRILRRHLGPALLRGKGRNNRWIIGLDLWSIDISIMISLIMLIAFLANRLQIEMSYLVMLPLLIRNILVPRVVTPLLSRWGVPQKPTPSLSDWDREFIA